MVRARVLLVLLVVGAGLVAAGPVGAVAGEPWVWPLEGPRAVSRPFEPPATRYGPGHRGADLPGHPGAAVRAAGAGRVSYAGLLAGRGVVVVVHGDLRTTYEPVTAVVRVGQLVGVGQLLGRLAAGHLGCPGTCLHWGLLRGDVYLDPVRLVRAGPPRLLPLDASGGGAPTAPYAPPVLRTGTAAPAGVPRAGSTDVPFALRAADAAWGTGALLALIAGLALVRRPGGPRGGPAAPSMAASPDQRSGAWPQPAVMGTTAETVVDLASERNRRRPHVA